MIFLFNFIKKNFSPSVVYFIIIICLSAAAVTVTVAIMLSLKLLNILFLDLVEKFTVIKDIKIINNVGDLRHFVLRYHNDLVISFRYFQYYEHRFRSGLEDDFYVNVGYSLVNSQVRDICHTFMTDGAYNTSNSLLEHNENSC